MSLKYEPASVPQVLPVDCMLVQLGENKENVAAAVESMAPAAQDDVMQVPEPSTLNLNPQGP